MDSYFGDSRKKENVLGDRIDVSRGARSRREEELGRKREGPYPKEKE